MSTSTSRSGTAAAALILIMLLSSLLGAFQPDVEVQEDTSSLFNEDVVLTLAQQGAINRVTGRASTTDFVTTGVPTSGSANSEGDENSVTINSLALKPLGNVVVAGSLRGEVHFDNLTAIDQDFHNAFVAELTPYGTWQWLSQTTVPMGATDSGAFGLDVTVSSGGEIFLVGVFRNVIEFGTDLEYSIAMSKDGFIAKLDSSGNWEWGSTFGGIGDDDSMNGVAVDSNGDAYVVGAFRDHAFFDNTSYNHGDNEDAFVTKVNRSSGEYEWVSFGRGAYDENGTAIVIDGNDRIFATGYYHGAPVFGSTTLGSPGNTAAWVGEMDINGTWQWANAAVTTYGAIIPLDITYGGGGIYICGAMSGLVQIDGVAHWANSTGSPGWNAFVGQLAYNGSWNWLVNSSGHTQVARGIGINPLGGVVITGWFDKDDPAIANATFGAHSVINAAYSVFVAGVSPSGQWMWAMSAGGPLFDSGTDAMFSSNGKLLVAGQFCLNQVAQASGCGMIIDGTLYFSDSFFNGSGFVWGLSTDSDLDNRSDLVDNCPLVPNYNQTDMDSDQIGDVCDDDMDGDGRLNVDDDCPAGVINWDATDWALDADGDGCRDSDEDLDDDNDGVPDSVDDCFGPDTLRNWTANDANDYDRDGCHDTLEDDDDDGDGVDDVDDDCAFAPSDRNWTSSLSTDYDSDGCRDAGEDLDDDNDGVLDEDDNCATGELGWNSTQANDMDSDGCRDWDEDFDDDGDQITDTWDDCLTGAVNWNSSGDLDLDNDGCRDTDEDFDDDNDGVADVDDDCPRGVLWWFSNSVTDNDGDGCKDSGSENGGLGEDTDDDGDGLFDDEDDCPQGVTGWFSTPELDGDRDGCHDELEDWDDDGDGLWEFDSEGNVIDRCPGTPQNEIGQVDGYGCSPSQADSDGDGVQNLHDNCPDIAAAEGMDIDGDGCTDDIDGDGITDDVDDCLDSPNAVVVGPDGCTDDERDTDGDGVQDGDELPRCRNTPAEHIGEVDIFGCWDGELDDDKDGVMNADDTCPDTPTAELEDVIDGCGASQRDEDGDGVVDSADLCPWTDSGDSVQEDGCSDAQLFLGRGGDGALSGMMFALIVLVLLLVAGGITAAVVIRRRREEGADSEAPSVAADAAIEQPVDDTGDLQAEDVVVDGDVTVDEHGTSWWEDELGAWWYRTPEMDDWSLFDE